MYRQDAKNVALPAEQSHDTDLQVMSESEIEQVAGGFNLTWEIIKIIFN